jgi:xanthine dehydrogenase small subunit
MTAAGQQVRFVLDGKVVTVENAMPTVTLLQFLRDSLGHCGTKEGCAEGDCGACTTVIGELRGTHIEYRAINSCIRFLPTLDGKEVVTVECLQADSGALHPVQQAMVDCHGSQCGFCTPGFVMSLFGLFLKQLRPSRAEVVEALSGNLCRCTGYRPIIDAALSMDDYPQPAKWSREHAQSTEHRELLRSIQRDSSLELPGSQSFHAPRTLDELAALYEREPQSLLLAGGTDIGLWVTKLLRQLPPIIYLGEVAGLGNMTEADGMLEIGAAVSLADACAAIVAHYPMLAEIASRFASVPIRNSGTLCGNIANGSPIGDSMPILIALGAVVELRRGAATRALPLEELYLGYQKKAFAAGEFLASVKIPLPQAGRVVASYKISKRFDQDISGVCSACVFDVADGHIVSARIAYGGMAATPARARHAEAALAGKPWSLDSFEAAISALARDYQPLSDMRASAGYRAQVAGNLLKRFYLEHSATPPALRVYDRALVAAS